MGQSETDQKSGCDVVSIKWVYKAGPVCIWHVSGKAVIPVLTLKRHFKSLTENRDIPKHHRCGWQSVQIPSQIQNLHASNYQRITASKQHQVDAVWGWFRKGCSSDSSCCCKDFQITCMRNRLILELEECTNDIEHNVQCILFACTTIKPGLWCIYIHNPWNKESEVILHYVIPPVMSVIFTMYSRKCEKNPDFTNR